MGLKYVNFVKTSPNAKVPTQKYVGDAGWDLFVSQSTIIPPNVTVNVHTDIRIDMPQGIFGRLTGRSSTLRRHNLLVNEGIIDNGFTGELYLCIRNLNDIPFEVKAGMRLGQIIFQKIEDIRWSETEFVANSERGERGFGSTGD